MSLSQFQIPVIPIWGQLLVPIQGDVTDEQIDALSQDVLRRVSDTNASGLVIDVSGVAILDSHLCSVLARLARAARFMGARSVLCGLKPEIALSLKAMGVELDDLHTERDLESALKSLGIQVMIDDVDDEMDSLSAIGDAG